MADINHVGDLDIGTYLKIFSTKGVYNNLSEASELWKLMLKKRVAKPEGREVKYLLRKAYGQSAFQFLAPGAEGSFPGKQRTEQVEASLEFKDFGTTIDVPRHLLNKTGSDLAQYGEPLAEETNAKGIATARGLSRMLMGDGSGSLGVIGTTPTDFTGGRIAIALSTATGDAGASHIGNMEEGEKVQLADITGATSRTVTGGTVDYYKVYSIDEENDSIVVEAYTSADVLIVVTATTAVATDRVSPLFDNTVTALPDASSVTDYGKMGFIFAGLESLAANDGRVVNGLTMTGAISGTRKDASAATIDRTHFQSVLSEAKRRVGKNRYKWNSALMFDTTYDAMLESWETDRMIISAKDSDRGADQIGYKHQKDKVNFDTDEFISKQRIIMCPEGDVLQFRGTDIEQVELGGQKFFMPNDSSGNHQRIVRSYLEGSGALFTVHPAAIAIIENFTV